MYYKGSLCVYNSNVLCQEGYCDNCNLKGGNMKFSGICKAKDLLEGITKEWVFHEHGIGQIWILDETDTEIIGVN